MTSHFILYPLSFPMSLGLFQSIGGTTRRQMPMRFTSEYAKQ